MNAAGVSRCASRRPTVDLPEDCTPVMSVAVGSISVGRRRSRRGVARAVGVDGPCRDAVPVVLVDELGEGPAAHRPVVSGGPPERDGGGDGDLGGDVEERAQLGLHEGVPRGHDAAVPEGAGGEQQVLAGRVDARALRRMGIPVADEAREHHDRGGLELIDEVLHRAGHAGLG